MYIYIYIYIYCIFPKNINYLSNYLLDFLEIWPCWILMEKHPFCLTMIFFVIYVKDFRKFCQINLKLFWSFSWESSGYNTRQFWVGKRQSLYLSGVTERSIDQYFENKIFLKNFIDPFHEKLSSFQKIFQTIFRYYTNLTVAGILSPVWLGHYALF